MTEFSKDFAKREKIKIQIDKRHKRIILGTNEIVINVGGTEKDENTTSYFDIVKRTYTKKHNLLEKRFMNFILGYRARFVPE